MPVFGTLTSSFRDRESRQRLSQGLLIQGVSTLLGLGTLFCGTSPSFADIQPSLSTFSNVLGNCSTAAGCTIRGGYQQDDNLFHGFDEFAIPPSGNVTLGTPLSVPLIGSSIPSNVERIFIRVVDSITDIEGSFSVDAAFTNSPDIMFLSPQGIRIGGNAQLNYPGNFLFSTAERLDFGNGAIFDATDNTNPLFFTISGLENIPTALELGNSLGTIEFANQIEIPQTQHQFSIIGGGINFDNVEVSTPGNIYVASVNNNQSVGLSFSSSGIDFAYGATPSFRTIQLVNSTLSSRSLSNLEDAGSLQLVGQDLQLRQSALGTLTDVEGGNISLDFTGLVDLNTTSQISSRANRASAVAGEISIHSGNLGLAQNSLINSFTTTSGGDINLDVAGDVSLNSQSEILTQATTPTANAGNINLSAASLELQAQNQISTSTNARGGEIRLTVPGIVQVGNSSNISTSAGNSSAIAGNINLSAGSLNVDNIGKITSGFNGFTAGSINIVLASDLTIDGDGEIATSATDPSGLTTGSSTGNISIAGTNLSIQNSGEIYTLTEDLGGTLSLDFTEDLSLGTASSIAVLVAGTGNAEALNLTARNLSLANQSEIRTQTGQGGGILNVTVGESTAISTGSSIASKVNEGSGAAAGELNLIGQNLSIDGSDSLLFSLTENGGGNLNLELANDVALSNGAQLGLFLTPNGDAISGNAGSISLEAINLSLNNNASIITETANGHGNINIELLGGDLAVIGGNSGNSEIIAKLSTTKGTAGDIAISANNITFDQGLLLTETDQPGGNIDVDATNAIQFNQSQIRLSSPTGTGHTGNLRLTSQSGATPTGISLIATEILNEASNTGGDVTFTAQGEVALRDGSFISVNSSGAQGDLRISASALRSNAINADNDIQLTQGSLSNISLPTDITGFDLLANQVDRSNGNSEIFPNSFPGLPPSPPPVIEPPVIDPPTLPIAPPPVTPTTGSPPNPPVNRPTVPPLNPTTAPNAGANDDTPASPNNRPSKLPPTDFFSQPTNLTTLGNVLQFYGYASSSVGSSPWGCSAAGESGLKISGRGGVGSNPFRLDSSISLTDLGRSDKDTAFSSLDYSSRLTAQPLQPSPPGLEAQAWQRDHHGKIQLIAQSSFVSTEALVHRCQSLEQEI